MKTLETKKLLAIISRDFLENKKVCKIKTKKVAGMSDDEVIQNCHHYCEEMRIIEEWKEFREKAESAHRYCSYLEEYIDEALCYDLQMISSDYIKSSALPRHYVDKERCLSCCAQCKYVL